VIEIGQTVGNYIVNAQVGEGGMGVVFLAEHPVIGRKVALKVIHPQYARSHEVVSRFITEAKAVNQIGHEHIVDITDFGTTPAGDFYFVMEYLQGSSLAEVIHEGPRFSPDRALRICAQIADALQASHDHGVIHRDLKPENIFLVTHGDDHEFVKVLDFGLAKLVNPSAATTPTHNTKTGLVLGTPYYMAPEQCEGTVEIDHRADVYALGVLLFEMLTGQVPFGGNSYGTIMLNQINLPAPSARSLVPDLPPALDAIVSRALAKNPAHRFQSMAELRAALLDPTGYEAGHSASSRKWTRFRRGTTVAALAVSAFVVFATTEYRRPVARVAAAAHALSRPATVRVNFNSDPPGATVAREDGKVLGVTPLSTTVPFSEAPQRYVVSKAAFRSKSVSLVPNLPSPVFAVLQADKPAQPPAMSGPGRESPRAVWADAGRRPTSRARRAHDQPRRPAAALDDDAILPLSSEE
jgi:serine/threonine protein kinase